MLLRTTIRRNLRCLTRVIRRGSAQSIFSPVTKLANLRQQAESTLNLLRAKPLPQDFNALFLDHLKLRLMEFILQPSPSPAMLLKYFEIWAKYLAKTAVPDSAPNSLPTLPAPNVGIKPETMAFIEQQLKLM